MKILIVDDNKDDLTLLRHIVERNGHEAIEARQGKEALELAERQRPDLIISDALMPVMDGFLFLKRIKEDKELRSIPFIFYSASYQADRDLELARSLGACGYIFKPMEPKELWAEVERTLERSRQEQPVLLTPVKADQLKYLEKYSEIVTIKLEEKVEELEKTLRLRQEAEQKLKEQKEFLQRSIDALTHPFYVINANDYTIALANTASCFQDYRQGAKCYELTHNRHEACSGEEHPCIIAEIKKTKCPVSLEHIHYGENGEQRYVEVHGYPIFGPESEILQIIEYCVDITDRKQGEEERRRLTTVMEQAADSIVITDKRAIIQYVNPSFEKITGYTAAEAIGKNPRILQSGSHNAQFYRQMWSTLSRGEVWRGHFINKKKDGSLFDEEASITPVLNDAGKIVNYVALKRDVTDQKKLEEKLHHAQTMEAIGTLAGGIAHDFNNILTAILGYAELVFEQLPAGSRLRMNQEQVLKAGGRAKELVRQILTFSRQRRQERIPVLIHLVVKEAIKLLRASIPSIIEIKDDIDPKTGMVLIDPTQLHQIVMNLCTNAYHSMRESGGVLGVRLDVRRFGKDDLKIMNFSLVPGTYVRLEVSDTGCGMNKQILEKIFEPYFTTKKSREGTGLGLSIVHGIVKSCEGDISVYSEPGKGTTFCVYLPQILNEGLPAITVGKEECPRGTEKIMIVDDEEAIVNIEQQMLKILGYQTYSFTNSQELLQVFQSSPGDFDLIITDMTMPAMTGAELSQRLLAIRPDIPIILCTGYSEWIDKEKAAALGIKEYLMKPVGKKDLALAVRKVLDGNNS
ncbi:MAG: response regulator [Proteobacteria bacterium]|nr:response regulator [Pseudomonadota bacterium]MBU4294898.1 response regulator [Pseudomonadota bacterium]MCG2747347.1 response regulator [Desulfobulbaceae bacterium]